MKIETKWTENGVYVEVEFKGYGEQYVDETIAIFDGLLNFAFEEDESLGMALIHYLTESMAKKCGLDVEAIKADAEAFKISLEGAKTNVASNLN